METTTPGGLWPLLLHHFSYQLSTISLLPFHRKLLVLAYMSLVNVLAGACVYRAVSGSSWSTSLFKVYGVLFRAPGVPVSAEATVAASLVVNGLFVFGMFVFALLIGMISDEIKQQVWQKSSAIQLLVKLNCNRSA